MDTLLTEYNRIYESLKIYKDQLEKKQSELNCINRDFEAEKVKISEENILNINELKSMIVKVKAFVDIAKTHALNVMEADGPIEFNRNLLSRLAVQINSSNSDDPFASKLYTEATGQLIHLENELSNKERNTEKEISHIEKQHAELDKNLRSEIADIKKNVEHYFASNVFTGFIDQLERYKNTAIGTVKLPLPLFNDLDVPLNIPMDEGGSVIMEYENENEMQLLRGIQQFILNFINHNIDNNPHITFIDTVRYNSSGLGSLSILCGEENSVIERIPMSIESVRMRIKSIISELNYREMSGIDEKCDKCNKEIYIFHNFPHGYDAALVAQIQQLCVNALHYGITVILTTNLSGKSIISSDVLEYLKSISLCINNNRFYFEKIQKYVQFSCYEFQGEISDKILKRFVYEKPVIDRNNEYEKRIGLPIEIKYKKGCRRLENIPFAINKNGEIEELNFENSNFATFVCGASRSGKSTLLHTLISGIIKKMHPDDVEIWLVDFKMTEFSRYIEHLPPHIRYIILDESPELVYDIINRLTEILQKRQNIFKGKWLKLDDVPTEKYMPSILVIIDEFSVMAQIIADSLTSSKDNYSVKLQTLLAKGAALGLHFIFASQGFTSGTRGLNDFSKKQIQQRIAMKTEFNEIRETLDLKSVSDDDKAMMEQLPVHHTLTRKSVDSKGNHLNLSEVLYINDYTKQEEMIDGINCSVIAKSKYDLDDEVAYIDKKTMIIDGNSYHAFQQKSKEMENFIQSRAELLYDNNTAYLFLGEPRRMLQIYPVQVENGFCENILIISPHNEKMASTSIVLSMQNSLELQGKDIEIWTNKKNAIYKQIIGDCNRKVGRVVKDLKEVCERIKSIKISIEQKRETNSFFVLLGFEALMMDMAFQETSVCKNKGTTAREQTLISVSIEKRKPGEMDLLTQLAHAENSLIEDINFKKNIPQSTIDNDIVSDVREIETVIYDAREDLKYILTHGPNLGYHFIMIFNSVAEVKQSKIDLAYFKHKILFRTAKSEAIEIIGSAGANVISELDDHIFRYTNGLDSVSFRPCLHEGLEWDGWRIGSDGNLDTFEEEEYLL